MQGRTPLRISLLEGSLDIAGLLLDNAADIDYVDTDSRSSLYIMALENDVKTVEFLLNHGANTELKDCDGRTALHVAAWQGYTDIVQVRASRTYWNYPILSYPDDVLRFCCLMGRM